jgi:hypothetical protein
VAKTERFSALAWMVVGSATPSSNTGKFITPISIPAGMRSHGS